MEVVNQVKKTTDYSMFKSLTGNRGVNELHVRRLKQSFERKYLFSPILVNQKFQVIDGQHRFEAAKELNLPIYFMVVRDYGLNEVQILNTNMKNWKKEDYLNAFCDLKYPEYLKFRNFKRKYPDFGIASSEALLLNTYSGPRQENVNGKKYYKRYFEEGELVIPNVKKSEENAEKILMIKKYYDGYNRPGFVRAMIGIFKVDEYNHSQLLQRLQANPTALQHCSNVTQYKLLIEEIYNFRSRDKVNLRF